VSKGLGRAERAIVEFFASNDSKKCVSIEKLAEVVYRPYFIIPGKNWPPGRAEFVAVRRALKRLQNKGYPLRLMRIPKRVRGRPMIVLWTGDNRCWWRHRAATNPDDARRAQEFSKLPPWVKIQRRQASI
jgi:hypothetical protein